MYICYIVVSDDPLGLFSAQTPDISKSTPKSATLASTNTQQPAVTMDIGMKDQLSSV